MDNTEIVKVESNNNVFINKESFEHAQRVATMLSKSDLVPVQFKGKVDNCVIALNMAGRMGADPLMVMQNMYIVHGKPAWSSQFLIATLNACGKFSPLRYEEDDKEGGRCRAIANDLKSGEKLEGVWVSMDMAKAEGWVDKNGSKWKTMPQLMRRYRAGSFFTKQFAPEVSMGFQTVEEVEDVPFVEIKGEPIAEIQPVSVAEMLEGCDTPDKIEFLKMENPNLTPEELKLVDAKAEQLVKASKKK